MTNVSLRSLSSSDQAALMRQLGNIFTNNTLTQSHLLFSELLTPAEQILLIKRLAIILLIHEKQSLYRIADTLDVSANTVRSHKLKYQKGIYHSIVKRAHKKSFDSQKFWHVVDTVLRAGLPPIAGPGRWGDLQSVKGTRTKQ